MARDAAEYPEHEKLRAVKDRSQTIGEFLEEWCAARRMALCELVDVGSGGEPVLEYVPVYNTTRLLAEFFEIDLDRIEAEKRTMLDLLRKANDGS